MELGPGVRIAIVQDPFGNAVEVVQSPSKGSSVVRRRRRAGGEPRRSCGPTPASA